MGLRQTLATPVDEWNHPRRVTVGTPLVAAVGGVLGSVVGQAGAFGAVDPALVAGAGAGLATLLGWVVAAALD